MLHAVLRMVNLYMPNYLGDADKYIPANPGVTPPDIVPSGIICRSTRACAPIPNKLAGVDGRLFSAIIILAFTDP